MDAATSMAIEEFRSLLRLEEKLRKQRLHLDAVISKLTAEQRAEYWKVTEEINQRW